MELNYPLIGLVIFLVIGLIIFLIRRNRKDKKSYERELIDSEIKPEKHDADRI